MGVIKTGATVTADIVFGTPFPNASYSVSLTCASTPGYWGNVRIATTNRTATGFRLTAYNQGQFDTAGDIFVDWIAALNA